MFSQSCPSGMLLSTCSLLQKALMEQALAANSCLALAALQSTGTAAGGMLQQKRCKHEVRMVLLKDHEKLGQAGDIVTVTAGYARHYLFPSQQADYAVPSVIQDMKARGVLSSQALQQLGRGSQQSSAAAAVDPATLPLEQQMPQILRLLSERGVVVGRRFNIKVPEQPMIGRVTADHLVHCVAQQLKIDLPPELVLMHRDQPINQFGSFRVPLNLRSADGGQVELAVSVQKTRRSSRVRQLRERWLLFTGQQQKQQATKQAQV